jgi:hypothetical protein
MYYLCCGGTNQTAWHKMHGKDDAQRGWHTTHGKDDHAEDDRHRRRWRASAVRMMDGEDDGQQGWRMTRLSTARARWAAMDRKRRPQQTASRTDGKILIQFLEFPWAMIWQWSSLGLIRYVIDSWWIRNVFYWSSMAQTFGNLASFEWASLKVSDFSLFEFWRLILTFDFQKAKLWS